MNIKSLLNTTLLAACCWVMSPVMASTADGETPAEESVCDDYQGALGGLCNAYCEALDCDSQDPRASDTACAKVAANFNKHDTTGAGLPCEQVACPCKEVWEASEDIDGVLIGDSAGWTISECFDRSSTDTINVKFGANSGGIDRFTATVNQFAEGQFKSNCELTDGDGPTFIGGDIPGSIVSDEELASCEAFLQSLCDRIP